MLTATDNNGFMTTPEQDVRLNIVLKNCIVKLPECSNCKNLSTLIASKLGEESLLGRSLFALCNAYSANSERPKRGSSPNPRVLKQHKQWAKYTK